ncbi:MAG: HAD family phosphatase [Solirubrobacterales bacterium]|nr:HAD family phosphatase [Solirubrobacterales bacterium]
MISSTPARSSTTAISLDAIIFDLDGVLIDSEGVWNAARREVATSHGGHWPDDAQRAMMGMSSTEWSTYMTEDLGVQLSPQRVSETVVERLVELYREHLPLLPGAREAVTELARKWPLALASSANRSIIDLVLELAELEPCFSATLSSEEVPRGKPAPDVYLEAARRLGVPPNDCAAVEDSSNGLRSAAAAEMLVIALPNREFPPQNDALALAADVLGSIAELTPQRLERLASSRA